MVCSRLVTLLFAGPVLAQSLQAKPGSSASSPSRTSQQTPPSSQQQSSTSSAPDSAAPGGDYYYSQLITEGMKPDAASYAEEKNFNIDSNGLNPVGFANAIIQSKIETQLSENKDPHYRYAQQLSIDAYFLSLAPSGYEQFASSFVSVWYSYQGITPDASESVRLHSKVDPPVTMSATTSRALGASLPVRNSGVMAAVAVGIAGLLGF